MKNRPANCDATRIITETNIYLFFCNEIYIDKVLPTLFATGFAGAALSSVTSDEQHSVQYTCARNQESTEQAINFLYNKEIF